jgi:hypothetical protein
MDAAENFRRFTELRLGISGMEIELLTRAETRYATRLIVQQCQAGVDIFSRDLDAPLYDQEPFLEALGRSHRLIELSRRLSSVIELRQPHPDYRRHNEAFLVADGCGLIHRSLADRYEGTANFYDPVAAQRALAFFTEVWERSESSPEFRRLHL